MATPHISARKDQIAKTVFMAGDPLRVKLFIENYMDDAELVSDVRGILAYTGTYKGKRATVMAHGMGLGSMGIYTWELYEYYEVERIIRFGSAGGYGSDVNVLDFHIAEEAWTTDNFGESYNEYTGTAKASVKLVESAKKLAEKFIVDDERKIILGKTHSTSWFYRATNLVNPQEMDEKGIKTVEMESYALYVIANWFKREALTVLTVSDHLVTHESLSADDRRTKFTDMFKVIQGLIEEYGE